MNERDDGRPCCADRGAQAAQEHAKRRIKQLDKTVKVKYASIKPAASRCDQGPVLVVYPQGTLVHLCRQSDDIDEIIDVDLLGGGVVERLKV